jgi:hypothetical protein
MTDRAHQAVCDTLGHTLALGGADAWHGFSLLINAHLAPTERAALAWAALRSLPPDEAADVADTAIGRDLGPPAPPFNDLVAEADFWVSNASPRERAAYAEALAWTTA